MASQNTKAEKEVKKIIKKKVKQEEELKQKFEKLDHFKAKNRGLYLKNIYGDKKNFSEALKHSFK